MITVKNVSKNYRIYHSPADRLKEIVTRRKYHKELKALSGISFTVSDGETLGIVGENGAGKSTLLKILQGVIIPDEGEVSVTGKVTGLLELGTGFNSELSGVENIYMNGTMLGMSREELDAKKDEIINFTELGDAIYDPIKTYSSGMLMRLGFSIAIHADPVCFLVDEALSVGDAYFQQKCMRAIQAFKEKGGSIIFVSHDMNALMTICDSAVLLENGKILAHSSTKGIIDLYVAKICQKSHIGSGPVKIKSEEEKEEKSLTHLHSDLETGDIEFISISILNSDGEQISHIISEETAIVKLNFKSRRVLEEAVFGIQIRNRLGVSVFGTNSHLLDLKIPKIKADKEYCVYFSLELPIYPGDYLISVAIDNKAYGYNSFEEYCLRLNDIFILKVIQKEKMIQYEGMIKINTNIKLEECRGAKQ